MDVQELAKLVLAQFESKQRDGGGTFLSLKEGHEEWMHDLCHDAHGGKLPDDHCYDMIHTCLDAIAGHDSIDDARDSLEPDVYNRDRLAWLSSHLDRAEYCNRAVSEQVIDVSSDFSILEVIGAGQMIELQEIFDSVLENLENQLSEME